jgi:lipoprotein-releasing system permease protein
LLRTTLISPLSSGSRWKALLDERRSVILGSELAQDLGRARATASRYSAFGARMNGSPDPLNIPIQGSRVVSSGYQDLDGIWALIRLDEGFRLLPASASRSFVGVKTR